MSRRAFTPLDGFLVAMLLLANWFVVGGAAQGPPDRVEVTSSTGTERVALPPRGERRLEVGGPLGTTVIVLDPDGARVLSSPCPLHLCVRAGKIARPGAVVACLPNRVALRLTAPDGEPRGGVDAVGR